jgi:hypothetical protein
MQHAHRHIPAHREISHQEMAIWGRANDDCDMEAKELWLIKDAKSAPLTSMKLHDEPWVLWIRDEKMSTQVRATLCNHIHDPQAVLKWHERGWDASNISQSGHPSM